MDVVAVTGDAGKWSIDIVKVPRRHVKMSMDIVKIVHAAARDFHGRREYGW